MSIVISKKNRFIFFHLPKNAGSAVSDILNRNESYYTSKKIISKILKNFSKNDNFFFDNYQKKLHFFRSHVTISYIENIISPKIFNDYFKFAVVRNPFSRFVSRYNYTKLVTKNSNLKFPIFLTNHLKYKLITDQQYKFLLKKNGEIGVDKIIKFENLNRDLNDISSKINTDLSKFKKMNASTFDDYKKYYNNETINLVKNYCKKDLEFFNYDF